MIRLVLFLWLLLATQAFAAPILVKSGEHNGFTRLVVDYGRPVQWQVGRTEDGYALRVDGAAPEYDFSQSFKIIGTSRLVALNQNARSGDLQIGVACRCYAIPFEFRDGIIVVDLRDGPPPKGSSFEAALAERVLPKPDPPPAEPPQPLPVAKSPYDWTSRAIAQATGKPEPSPEISPAQAEAQQAGLESLRETLIGQLGHGASQGIIELAVPKAEALAPEASAKADHAAENPMPSAIEPSAAPQAGFAAVRSGLGELPSIAITSGAPEHADIGAKGESCFTAEDMDLSAWRGEGEVAEQMQRATQNLLGEFDRPDPEALTAAIRFYLSIGFGAEARQMMRAFPSDLPQVPLWQALANLVDGLPDDSGLLAGQMGCDTPAALWAILANPAVEKGDLVNSGAAYLAFSDLPIDLRRSLGGTLADRFLAMGDKETATRILDAILRAPGVAGPKVTLLDAAIDMQSGEAAAAEQKLQAVVDDPGPSSTDATIALIEAKVAQNLPVEPDLVTILAAMVQERQATPDAAQARRALILAQAASGDFASAFKAADQESGLMPILWRLLAKLGDDNALLTHGVLDPTAETPRADRQTQLAIAARLADLGMAEAARQWIVDDAGVDPLLLAKIDLQRRDARGVLRVLAGQNSPEALPLQAAAFQQLGDEESAARILDQIGNPEAALQARARAQNWPDLSTGGSGGWQSVAQATEKATLTPPGPAITAAPLAFGKSLLDKTAATRSAIDGLLAQVSQP
jgi:hypothetical protein